MAKAHFVYEFEGKIQDLFDVDYTTKQTLGRTKLTHVETIEYLKRVIVASDLNLFKKTIQFRWTLTQYMMYFQNE